MTSKSTILTLEELLSRDLDYICSHLTEEFSAMAGKKLLITGGAGFLGYYLVQSVLHWNKIQTASPPVRITVYDNYIRGIPTWLTDLQSDSNLTCIKLDMTQPLPPATDHFDFIIHAAGIASPIYYRRHPLRTIDANINGLRNLLEHCVQQQEHGRRIGGFLFYSSSEIYGDPPSESIPTPEDFRGNVSCTGPRACYDESKRFGETLCVTFAREHDLPTKVARPFNNYGPGLKITDRRVLPDFARNVLNGRDIVMYSDGSPTRTFCYAADAVIGYYKVLVAGHQAEAYNIGVEEPEISMAELADKVAQTARELFGYQGRVVHQVAQDSDYLVDNPNRRCPNIEKARAHLGYRPRILIDDGLTRSLTWYHYHREAEEA